MRRQSPSVAILLAFVLFFVAGMATAASEGKAKPELRSLDPKDVLTKLDLDRPGIEAVKAKAEEDRLAALEALLAYYRAKYPLPKAPAKPSRGDFKVADGIVNHVLQWGPYEAADYGPEMNWEWDPAGDIEWVAATYRFYWARPLEEAFRETRDDKYARAFVELTSDWIAKHPLQKHRKTHPVYKSWRGFAWLDIQTGIRARFICNAFPVLVHGESFTPEFLGILLASLYDHQVKTEALPMKAVHNKAVFEQRGFVMVAATFPEFKQSQHWMKLGLERTGKSFLAQTTSDGVQREWSFGYHLGVLRDAVDIMRRAESVGVEVPADYRRRVGKMYDYIFAIATPDLGAPMFGDASRPSSSGKSRDRWSLYSTLLGASELLGDPKYAARARLDRPALPKQTSYAFSEAGTYVLRNEWGPDQIYFALHCPPRGISGHDQQDNGTFELCAYGRWLMPDTGYYTYGHDPKGRAWHRQTGVHQTLTLGGRNSRVAGRQLLWKTSPEADVVAVENAAYPGLTHRRTVWLVNKTFFVLLDEAIGKAEGALDLHFQLAVGDAKLNSRQHWASTAFDDANVLVWADPKAPVSMEEEEGWFACTYGHRQPRKAFRYRHARPAPAAFLSVLVPYRGTKPPEVSAELQPGFKVGADRVEIRATALGKSWQIGRDLSLRQGWCKPAAKTGP